MTRLLILTLALLGIAAPAASAAKLTYEPNGEFGTYVLAADATGGDLILSGVRKGDFDTIQLQYQGSIDYSEVPDGYCTYFEGDSRLYCGVIEGEGFRYEGTNAVDELSAGGGDLYPWLPLTFNGRGGNDKGIDGSDNTAPRVWDGGPGNDKLHSQNGPDRLLGGDGNDEMEGGGGSQELRGGAGNDVLRGDAFADDYGGDVLDGGDGFDTGDYWSSDDNGNDPTVNVTQDGAANDGRTGERDNVTSIEKIHTSTEGSYEGTPGDDDFSLYGSGAPNSAVLLAGNDKFDGSTGQETVDGGAGDDDLKGGFGHDTITGGPGQDVINGDGGSYCGIYSCSVPFGNDTINARDGEADSIECGVGQDKVTADAADTVAPSCETVDRPAGGTTPGGTAPGGTPPGGTTPGGTTPGTTTPASVGLRLLSRKSLRALLRSGLRFELTCPAPCAVTGRLVHKGKTIGTGRKTLLSAGKAKVLVKVSRKQKAKLRRLRKAPLTLKVAIKDAAGETSSVTQSFSFRK